MENKIGLIDYAKVFIKYRRLIFWNTFIVTVFALIISLVIPKKYTSTASLLPPLPGTDILSNLQTSMLGNLRGIPGLTSATTSDLFASILKSNTVMDSVITECNLMKVYKTKTFKDTRKRLMGYTTISVGVEGIVGIQATANSPILAKIILDSYIKNLDLVNKNLVMTTGKRNRIFIEKRLGEVNSKLKTIEDSLCIFQELNKTISIENEIKPVLEGVADIKAKIISTNITLAMLRVYATEENPEILGLKSQLKELNNELHKVEYEKDDSHFGIGFSIPLNKLPTISLELLRLTRDIKIQEKVLGLLTEQYELAKSQEIKDTPTVNILEIPTIPEKKSFPKRSVITGIAFMLSFFTSVFLAFFLNWINNLPGLEKNEWQRVFNTTNKKIIK
jgi:tyrosine-protein kinase Etk/Wzc